MDSFVSFIPESAAAAMRYLIALVSVAAGVASQEQSIQIASAVVTLITVAYGIWRTHQLEKTAQ